MTSGQLRPTWRIVYLICKPAGVPSGDGLDNAQCTLLLHLPAIDFVRLQCRADGDGGETASPPPRGEILL